MNNPKFINLSSIIDGLYLIDLDKYEDLRGANCETFNTAHFNKAKVEDERISDAFLVDSISYSKKDSLRGFHGDEINSKLIQCLYGEIQFCVIDVRPESKTFRHVFEIILNYKEPKQVLIPKGCVNAHLCLSEQCIFYYKLSFNYAKPEEQIHIKWNDPLYKIEWKTSQPILSERDR